ncbi:MAG: hypothetical protein M0C28_45350 [Candidatus Moduliflexus flocculans]|nr:hypothetical protein [Candidatus Moduliflexus flocculans]
MKEFFDHHLMGKPAPAWYTEGVSYLKLKDHLKERAKDLKPAEKAEQERTREEVIWLGSGRSAAAANGELSSGAGQPRLSERGCPEPAGSSGETEKAGW